MLLMRPVDIEVSQANDLTLRICSDPAHIAIKLNLRVAVNVQRFFEQRVFYEFAGPAVYGCRGGVDVLRFVFETVVQQRPGVTVVVLHHKSTIPLARIRTGALVQNCAYVFRESLIR